MSQTNYLVLKDINKSFSSNHVLKGVNFSARQGEIHGFIGGNGAGKSTLMNILGGIYEKDSGEIYIDNKPVFITKPIHSIQNGISFIHQELKLFSMQSVADNIFMSRLPTKGKGAFAIIDDAEKNRLTQKWLDMVGLKVSPNTIVNKLSIGEQQMVEIAKALSYESKIIIFDEPTSSLTSKEANILFDLIRKLKESGTCIIYISHKFEEIFELCDRVTVLRDGKEVGTVNVSETTTDELVSMVIGVRLEQYYPEIPELTTNEKFFEVKSLVNKKLRNVSFSVKKGEILGIFGLVGAGRSELARVIFVLDYLHSGEIYMNKNQKSIRSPKKAMSAGISFLTEDRRGEGLILNMSVCDNLNLPILNKLIKPITNWLNKSGMKKNTEVAIQQFHIKASNKDQHVKQLSGGNQQKVVLSKWFMTNSQLFILDEPTRGVDIKAKAEIYEAIVNITSSGSAVMIISSEALELLGVCHRILVMKDGLLVKELMRNEATEEKLLKYAMGDVS